ncbi:tRNA (adenosine(37)-N6)-threonylcarbamoyltransferase complex ATPase subunit type 1 TsaE [Desulfosporosinus sp. FKB]|uniref:tRNA (adenosine(37)-N6)-threonylcarbamoyltransferase complex ATPase subunit type 1 TsaE n=1 Tax=Desulfosporosinus sp. FKB TaxID=1969835 RepID=UPI000B49C363|nr:tRNA (adenosine(37)-N6)-threonylcarbamoyltransferase complex ATPase subunit type 1 TsaE [Desulfosporosinus sp. FKB]
MDYKVTSVTAEQTKNWGKYLAAYLLPGDVLALIGDLGAGKTAFAQGIGEGLGVTRPMASPTFTLIHEYEGQCQGTQIHLVHMDLYRLQHPHEAEVIGVEESFSGDSICLIEWPEIAEDYLPENRLDVKILGSGEQPREIVFHVNEGNWEQRITAMIHSKEGKLGGS